MSSGNAHAQRPEVMSRLWVAMAEMYGHRWESAYGASASTGAGARWARALAPYRPEQIAAAIEACRTVAIDWPPTLNRFVALCAGVPTIATVRYELARGPAAYSRFALLVLRRLDAYRWRRVDGAIAERMLSDAYDLAAEHVIAGGALPEPVQGLLEAPASELRHRATAESAAPWIRKIANLFASRDEATQ